MTLLDWTLEHITHWACDSVIVETGHGPDFCHPDRIPKDAEFVTMCQWSNARKASLVNSTSKLEWDGIGLPPVGIQCENRPIDHRVWGGDNGWKTFSVSHVENGVVFGFQDGSPVALHEDIFKFRPIQSEAEKQREHICDRIYGVMTSVEREGNRSDMAEAVYDAIASGKIPRVRIE